MATPAEIVKPETIALTELVNVPVRIDIVQVISKRKTKGLTAVEGQRMAIPAPTGVTLIKIGQRVAWFCTDPDTSITVRFEKGSPFFQEEFVVPGGEEAVVSGPVRDGIAVCTECPWKPLPHEKGHYKYSIVDNKTKEVLADPEVIIRN